LVARMNPISSSPNRSREFALGLIGGSVSSPFAVSPGWAMTNATGRLEVFPHGTDNSIQHAWQLYANQNSWSGWQQLDTSFSTFATWPSGVLNVDGREELFARRSDNQVVFTSQDDFNGASGWITWVPVSPSSLTFVSAVAAGRNSDGRLEIVALASDGHLYHNYQNNPADDFSWHGWVQMTQSFLGTPVMAQNLDGRLEIFAIGSDHALWWTVEGSTSNPSTPGWSSWNSLGGWWPGNTAAVIRNRVGQLEAFARGTTGYMYHAWQTSTGSNSWTSWHSMGGSWIGDPVAIMTRDQREQVFAVNSDHAIWWVVQVLGGTGADSGWSNWHSLGGWWPSTLAVAHNSDDRLEVFAPGTTHYLYNAVQDSAGNWSGWNSMGGSWQ
jgi:hypothetical protein